jgi:sec-independent protein translocase protein TatC
MAGKILLEWWRHAVVAILVLAAVVTPTSDPISMLMVAGPMLVLYGLGVGLARILG